MPVRYHAGQFPIRWMRSGDIWDWGADKYLLISKRRLARGEAVDSAVSFTYGKNRWAVTYVNMTKNIEETKVYSGNTVIITSRTECVRDGAYLDLTRFR